MQLHFFSTRMLTLTFSFLSTLFILFSCSEAEKPQEACISTTVSEVFRGDVITLTSCNQNGSDYKWIVEGGSSYKELHGQTVEYVAALEGIYTATLYVTDTHGTSSKKITFTVDTPGTIISEDKGSWLQYPEGVQLPNGNFMIQGENNIHPYQVILDNKFAKISSTTDGKTSDYLFFMNSMVMSDGVLVCGRDANSRTTDTKKFDFDGNLLWQKIGFPNTDSPQEGGRIFLIGGVQMGQIVAESSMDYNNKMNSYIHKMLGQGVSWSTKLVHSDNSTVRDIIVVNGQYIVLSVDQVLNKAFIAIVDDSGNIVDKKDLDVTLSEQTINEQSRIIYTGDQYMISVLDSKKSSTNLYWFDSNFVQAKMVTIPTSSLNRGIYATDFGYLLFGFDAVARIDKNGVLLSYSYYGVTIADVIKDKDGNFVMIGEQQKNDPVNGSSNSFKLVRISAAGKVIE